MNKKNIGKILLSAVCVCAVAVVGLSVRTQAQDKHTQPKKVLSSVLVHGTIAEVTEGRVTITRQDGEAAGQELVITVSDETRVLDAVNGFPTALDQLKSGETVYAYIGPAMTMSLPPISNGQIILTAIPADFKVPEYITVEELTLNEDGVTGTVTSTDETTYTVPSDCQIIPYLTRNIVTLRDLTKGRTALIWSGDDNAAAKIVLFTDSADDTAEEKGPGIGL